MCSIEEADQMMAVMKTDLPASFRITGTRSQANALLRIIESKYFSELTRAKESDYPGTRTDWPTSST